MLWCTIRSTCADSVYANTHTQTSEVITLNNQAVNLMSQGKFLSAYKILNEAIEKSPNYELARLNLSIILLHWSDKYFAKGDFEKALRYSEKAEFVFYFSQNAHENTRKCILALNLNPDSARDRLHLANLAISRNAPDEFATEMIETLELLKTEGTKNYSVDKNTYYKQRANDLAKILEKRLAKVADEKPFHYRAELKVYSDGSISTTFPPGSYADAFANQNKLITSNLKVDWKLYQTDRSKTFEVTFLHHTKYDMVTVRSEKTSDEYAEENSDSITSAEANSNEISISEATKINDQAVNLLSQGKYKESIALLKNCMDLYPDHERFRTNYSVALNNYALSIQNQRQSSLQLLEKALFYDFENETTRHNLDGALKMLRLNPQSIQVRLKLASQAIARQDPESAVSEIKMAMNLAPMISERKRIFYENYKRDLQKKIRAQWYPSRADSSQIVVSFDIMKNGKIANLKQVTSVEGIQANAAMDAVRNASPFARPLETVAIQFTFTYKAFDSGAMKAKSEIRPVSKKKMPPVESANLRKINEYQALLAEKQKVDDKSEESIDLRIKLVKLLVKEKYFELAEYLLEEGCELSPENKEMNALLSRVKKMFPKKTHPLPKNVS